MSYRIVRLGDAVRIEDKRFYMPFNVHTTCPKCGNEHTRDSSQSVPYPTPGKVMSLHFYCYDEEQDPQCGHEWSVDVVMDVTLELAPSGVVAP